MQIKIKLTVAMIMAFTMGCKMDYSKPTSTSMTRLSPIIENKANDWANMTTAQYKNAYLINYLHLDTLYYTFQLYMDTTRPGVFRPLDSANYLNFVYALAEDAFYNTKTVNAQNIATGGANLQLWYVYFPDATGYKRVAYTFYF